MKPGHHPPACRALTTALLPTCPVAGLAIVPLLAVMGKQIVQDMILGEVKGQLIGSLAGMGCKGTRLASLVATSSVPHGPGGLPGLGGLAGMGRLPGAGRMDLPTMSPGEATPPAPPDLWRRLRKTIRSAP